MRKPIVAGQFYEADPEELVEQIRSCFMAKLGPGMPEGQKSGQPRGFIVPHAGYFYSGPCAAYAYKEIAENTWPDVFVLLGLSHNGLKSCLSMQDWETPLGIVKVDKEFAQILQKHTELKVDEKAHQYEHSIEVQLPFLQFIAEEKELKIVPIIASHDKNPKEIGQAIKKAIKEYGKSVCIMASSDFTHYGINYGYTPLKDNTKENLKKLDMDAIEFIGKMDPEGFLGYVNKTRATICGAMPIAVLLNSVEGIKNIKLLKYYTSSEIMKSNSSVSYASIEFR